MVVHHHHDNQKGPNILLLYGKVGISREAGMLRDDIFLYGNDGMLRGWLLVCSGWYVERG